MGQGEPLPFAKLVGLKVTAVTAERVTAELEVRAELCTRPAVLHGGAVMTLVSFNTLRDTVIRKNTIRASERRDLRFKVQQILLQTAPARPCPDPGVRSGAVRPGSPRTLFPGLGREKRPRHLHRCVGHPRLGRHSRSSQSTLSGFCKSTCCGSHRSRTTR